MTNLRKESKLHFEVSSGLKSVLGSELITDEQVAFFELVKNSFDAAATRVDLYFGSDCVVISDNGTGMSFEDITNRWLRVAYSEKRENSNAIDYRDKPSARRQFAGSKGIGRFSTDRLGQRVNLQTRTREEQSGPVHSLNVDWSRFDRDRTSRFESLGLEYSSDSESFLMPAGMSAPKYGTVITITELRQEWERERILTLKSALAKLINPFGDAVDSFKIAVHAPAEVEADELSLASKEHNSSSTVNGEVRNFIFETLNEKTTFLDVVIDRDRDVLESKLIDRGELIYHIREPNEFPLLANSSFRCQLFFLNQAAKVTFTRRMGVQPVKFGSVFLFRNGFRVYPVGNEGDDWFGMDRRKQQGYRRFLGTRDVIGRIDVSATSDRDFQESTSRNDGLIDSPAVRELRKCFRERCLVRMERYVVPVTFADRDDKNESDISRLLTDRGRARVSAAIAALVDAKDVELLDYSRNLVQIISERSSQFEASLASLRAIAEKTQDKALKRSIDEAEKRLGELKDSEERARRQADEERRAKEAAQARAEEAERKAQEADENLTEERKRNLFLSSISNLDTETVLNLHHQVTLYSVDINQRIENILVDLAGREVMAASEVVNALEGIAFLNRKVMSIAKFATKANFRLDSEKIESDLGDYIEQYITGVASDFLAGRLRVTVSNDGQESVQRFKPIDIAIVIDNLISNARRAGATLLSFDITHDKSGALDLLVTDNGKGLDGRIAEPDRIFEKGFTTTHGSGLGLFHVKQVLDEMNGSIDLLSGDGRAGVVFRIRILA